MTATTTPIVSVEDLRRAYRAVIAGEFRHPSRPRPTPAHPAATDWSPGPGEQVVLVVGACGSAGASTVGAEPGDVCWGCAGGWECCTVGGLGSGGGEQAESSRWVSPWTAGVQGTARLGADPSGAATGSPASRPLPTPTATSRAFDDPGLPGRRRPARSRLRMAGNTGAHERGRGRGDAELPAGRAATAGGGGFPAGCRSCPRRGGRSGEALAPSTRTDPRPPQPPAPQLRPAHRDAARSSARRRRHHHRSVAGRGAHRRRSRSRQLERNSPMTFTNLAAIVPAFIPLKGLSEGATRCAAVCR